MAPILPFSVVGDMIKNNKYIQTIKICSASVQDYENKEVSEVQRNKKYTKYKKKKKN